MPDLLVPLYKLPPRETGLDALRDQNLVIRRANTFEIAPITAFIREQFGQTWADETLAALTRQPVSCFIAIDDKKCVGFGTYESTRKAYFGPTGVEPSYRGKGLGKALLIQCLWGLYDLGYAYGIIGAAGPVEFYQKTVGAIVIPDSSPGIYTDLLRKD